MREIKFRGKRIDSGEWVYGCLTRYSEQMSYITVDLIEDKIYEVLTETVGQYTGLKDKNGKEIYEGDVVLFKHEIGDEDWSSEIYFVEFKNGSFNIAWAFEENTCDECELLGNIYENPELMAEVDT